MGKRRWSKSESSSCTAIPGYVPPAVLSWDQGVAPSEITYTFLLHSWARITALHSQIPNRHGLDAARSQAPGSAPSLHLGVQASQKSQCSVTMSWGRQHTLIPEQSKESSPRPASSPEPLAFILSPRPRSPGHPWSKRENLMYLTTTPETERVSWKGDMEDPQEWMKQFFPSGTNKIQHDNEENTFSF